MTLRSVTVHHDVVKNSQHIMQCQK